MPLDFLNFWQNLTDGITYSMHKNISFPPQNPEYEGAILAPYIDFYVS